MHRRISLSILAVAMVAVNAYADKAPYGDANSKRYAAELLRALEYRGLVGPSGVYAKPYRGRHPHGAVLDTIEGPLTVGGRADVVIIKRNYGGADVSTAAVANDPAK